MLFIITYIIFKNILNTNRIDIQLVFMNAFIINLQNLMFVFKFNINNVIKYRKYLFTISILYILFIFS